MAAATTHERSTSVTTATTPQSMRILVVDDETAVREALQRALQLEHHEVDAVGDGQAALDRLADERYDAVVLDLQMPRVNGLEVIKRLREVGNPTPIVVVTAHGQVSTRVAGLDAGADDYLVKPFALEELLARLRAVTRRARGTNAGVLRFADLVLDTGSLRAERGGERIDLTRTEFALLQLFMRNPGAVLSRTRIFEEVWGYDFGNTSNSHEIYVSYLRRKTEVGGRPRLIHTIRGEGYVLREP